MNIKKLSILLICCICISQASDRQLQHMVSTQRVCAKVADDYFNRNESLIDFEDVNTDQKIDTESLIKWWMPVASGFTRPFFVLYSKIYGWWVGSSKRYVNR